MNIINTKLIAGVVVLGALLAPIAANANPMKPYHSVNWRLHNQQRRIDQGIRTDRLSAGETYNLERRDARIQHQEVVDRRHDHGHLTGMERRRLQREENRSSRAIYREKHDGRF